MQKVLRLLYQPYKWLIFVPFLALFTLMMAVVALLMVFLISPRFASKWAGKFWARVLAFFTPFFVRIQGKEHIQPGQSYVIVANHQSQYDILALYGWMPLDFRWVMKKELRKVPGLGIACEKMGHVFVDRSNTQAAVQSINEAKERIVDGTSVLFFPEGTRSEGGKMMTFKKGAFRFAKDLGLPVLPVTIDGTYRVLPTKTFNLFPGRCRLTIHPPISLTEDVDQLVEQTKEQIASVIK